VYLYSQNGPTISPSRQRIYDAFRNGTDAQRTFREIVFLREFGDHPNVVKLLNVHRAENDHDLYLVFEVRHTTVHTCQTMFFEQI